MGNPTSSANHVSFITAGPAARLRLRGTWGTIAELWAASLCPIGGNPRRLCRGSFAESEVRVSRMRQNDAGTRPRVIEARGSAELERALQSDDVALVDQKTFGMRLAEIIIRVRNLRTPRQRK